MSLDDFGAGYTSFRNLKAIAVDSVKIDGSFVRGVASNIDNQLFIRTLLGLAEGFGLETVAECVESVEEARHLARKGVKLFRPSKDSINIVGKMNEKLESVTFQEDAVADKTKDLSNNILHLARLFIVVLKRGEPGEVIECIKLYVLEEESDLSDLEAGAVEEKNQASIKQVIYY